MPPLSNVLVAMLNNPKIAPQLAFTHCGMFSAPQIAWAMSKAYMEEQEQKAAETASKDDGGDGDGAGNSSETGNG